MWEDSAPVTWLQRCGSIIILLADGAGFLTFGSFEHHLLGQITLSRHNDQGTQRTRI